MTNHQSTVIWLGLILVTLNLIINAGEIKSVLFGGGNSSSSNPVNQPQGNATQTPTPQPNPSPTPASVSVA